LTAPGLLRELGLADSGDRRLAAQAHFSAPARSGPRSFLAAILTRARLRRLISRLPLAPVLARSSLRSSLALAFGGSFLGSRSLRSSLVPRCDPHSRSPSEAHFSALSSSRLIVAVPDTWSPRLLLPLNATSTNPSPSAPSDLAVTLPVNRSGSFGNAGTPNRIASLVTIASGPAQSVRKRVHSPLVVRMFMNMLGDPCFLANSGSWWTGMKSRDAIAPATITVAVTGISSGVTSSPTLMSRQSRVVVRDFTLVICSPSSVCRAEPSQLRGRRTQRQLVVFGPQEVAEQGIGGIDA